MAHDGIPALRLANHGNGLVNILTIMATRNVAWGFNDDTRNMLVTIIFGEILGTSWSSPTRPGTRIGSRYWVLAMAQWERWTGNKRKWLVSQQELAGSHPSVVQSGSVRF